MRTERPDKWVVIKIINGDNTIFKVVGTWYGGYLGADRYKFNSGITEIAEYEDLIHFYGASGSCYICNKHEYGTNMFTQGIINELIEDSKKLNVQIEIIPSNTDWQSLITLTNAIQEGIDSGIDEYFDPEKLKQTLKIKRKEQVTPENMEVGKEVIDEEGTIGIISECKTPHNVYVKFKGGSGLYCLIKGCKESTIINDELVEISYYSPLYYLN